MEFYNFHVLCHLITCASFARDDLNVELEFVADVDLGYFLFIMIFTKIQEKDVH